MENTIERRNPEHYLDLTPYDALSNMQPKAGEIWTYGDWGEECIVINDTWHTPGDTDNLCGTFIFVVVSSAVGIF